MRNFFILICLNLFLCQVGAQNGTPNQALHLDGNDNSVRTGMGILNGAWTLETWIKGNDTHWKEREVIFGGGEYSKVNIADCLPLVVEKGRLHSTQAGLWAACVLDNGWHHVALSCDGEVTRLYLDGKMVDSKKVAVSVLPGALGVDEDAASTFGGLMDEVRIWNCEIPETILCEWMNKPLLDTHPFFSFLKGYYNFDDGIGDSSVNWVGMGDQAYHIRNCRNNYNGGGALAYTVVNDNPGFRNISQPQKLFNAIVIDSEWDADQGTSDDQVLKLRITLTGNQKPLSLTALSLDLSETTSLSDLSNIHIYYTGKNARSDVKEELFGTGTAPKEKMVFKSPKGSVMLTPGVNYFLVTVDVKDNAVVGNKIKISVPSFRLNKQCYIPMSTTNVLEKYHLTSTPHANNHLPDKEVAAAGKHSHATREEHHQSSSVSDNGMIYKQITPSRKNNPNVVKVLQWNIWHGGVHVGTDGLSRVIDLVKATNADIVTMQEGYGAQKRIADSLGYHLQTPSLKDNLALFSRFPIASIPSSASFRSNPAKVTLPDGRRLLVNACWLRYAYRPEYSCNYINTGHDTERWVAEDSILALKDIDEIITKDTNPYNPDQEIPVIIGGDFNSCSHLDWTASAAPLHYGYGPVPFPASRYLMEKGYLDSFREINSNECLRPEGTFAVIYGHLQVSRIDFLYYKGKNIKAISSKIIKTTPEIDDVWASDHAAVLTTFELFPPE